MRNTAKSFVNSHKKPLLHTSYLLFINLAIIAIILLALGTLQIINTSILLSNNWLFAIAIFSLTISILSKSKLNSISHKSGHFIESIFHSAPYFFLSILAIIAINQFLLLPIITSRSFHLVILGIAFGFLASYKNRNKIEQELEDEKQKEQNAENRRYKEFPHKFPTINKIWGLRSIVRWMYKEGWGYSVGLIAIVIVGTLLLTYNLGSHDFMNDEFPTMESASNYHFANSFWKWDWIRNESGEFTDCLKEDQWCHYTRAEVHSWLIAQFYEFAGISEFSTRILSAIFSIFFIIISYPISKYFLENKKCALLSTLLITFHPTFVELGRYARMYALLMPFTLLMLTFIYLSINYFRERKIKEFSIFSFLALVTASIAYNLQSQILLFFPAIFIFIPYMVKKSKKLIASAISILAILILGSTIIYFWSHLSNLEGALNFINFGERVNYQYLDLIFGYPIGLTGLIIFLVLFMIAIIQGKEKIIYLSTIVLISAAILIYMIDRFAHQVYSSNILPLAIMIISFSIIYISKMFNKKGAKIVIALLMIFAIISFTQSYENIYGEKNKYYAEYSAAYKPLLENYNPEKDALFFGYSRKYYLRELNYTNGPIHEFGKKNYTSEYEQDILSLIKEYDSGWITWDDYAKGDIKTSTRQYIENNFLKFSGDGLDNTKVEVFYFNSSMNP